MSEKYKLNIKWYEKITYSIVTRIENLFYKLGFTVASKPWTTIVICWLVVILSVFGLLRFHQEKNPLKLWVPPQSKFLTDTNWLMNKFQNGFREEVILIQAKDVLTPHVLYEVFAIDQEIKRIVTDEGTKLDDICFKIPDVDADLNVLLNFGTNSRRYNSSKIDPSTVFNTATYCTLIESMDRTCFQKNLLQLWNYDGNRIKKLTKQDILNEINQHTVDPILGENINYENLLGGIQRNGTGHIVSANALQIFYMVYVNFTAVDMDEVGNVAGTADWVSPKALKWEGEFINLMHEISNNVSNVSVFYVSARSFGDISAAAMFDDIEILVFGVFMMACYVQFVISKFNWVEARVALGSAGLLTVGMAFITACGLCSVIGISYGPVHTSLPFLLMGLGVDDMFVIVAAWEELVIEENASLEKRVGHMLKHAGVSITVTTMTDVLAFLIGSSTILPNLQSFCLYAAAGVFIIFIFVVTFFTACFTLDEKRIAANRNGIFIFYVHKNYRKNECSQRRISNNVFRWIYSKCIFTLPGKIIVILITVACAGFGIEGSLKLEQGFDPSWFIPKDNYLSEYAEKRQECYPNMGFDAGLYVGALDYINEIPNINKMVEKLENTNYISGQLNSWIEPFRNYVKITFKKDLYKDDIADSEFNLFLSKFLFSTRGSQYQANFRFDKELECGIPTTNITVSTINFRLNYFNSSKERAIALRKFNALALDNNFTTGDKFSMIWSKAFAVWVTDDLIDIEVLRNLQLALLCVMVCTVLLVANIQICFWIFVCVLLTIINVCGFMYRWGLTIDMAACIGLELGIGLCIDYATHIGHTFLTIQDGSLQERSLKTVVSIGSAVLYGGISTFIGVSMLIFSKAYAFHVFFKIFALVVIFGLFHGVVFLPVILSWAGPKPYRSHIPVKQAEAEDAETENL